MSRRKRFFGICLMLLAASVLGCGGAQRRGSDKKEGVTIDAKTGERKISKKARNDFADAVEKYKAAEAAGWSADSCQSAAKAFQKVQDKYGLIEAAYNVGVIYRSCGMMDKAREAFNNTLKKDPKHQLSMTHLAVMDLEAGNENRAEEMLRKAVGAGQSALEAVPAYVNAATILRNRGKKSKSDEAFKKAEMNLRRALAIDSKYMPALYQLAMLYLDQAVVKNKSSMLTLAMLVCSQGIKLNPEYGPIYHVYGMVLLQKNRLVDALKAFETAFQKDPKLFASYMNFGAINLNFRGYQEAKAAFEKAIALKPSSYEAHIGLGVALRGLGDFNGAKAEYKKASEINPKRTDYIFNVGVLEMDYLNPGTVEGYNKAKRVFQKFLSQANDHHREDPDGKGPLLSWVEKAQNRVKKCDENMKMIKEAEREMKEMEKLAAEQAKREAEMKAAMEKAKELEAKEAEGAAAPEEGATEGAEGAEATPASSAEGAADDKKADDSKSDGKKDAKAADKAEEKKDVKTEEKKDAKKASSGSKTSKKEKK
jgi:tetratricopeptide (TPR) repeat protein